MKTHIDPKGTVRHAAGSAGSKGGQFANKQDFAPTGALTEDTPKRSSQLTTAAIRESQQIMERTARQITRSFRIDEENAKDIVQDSWVHLLERDTRHGDITERVGEKPFLNLTTRKFANNYGNDARFGLRSEDFRARRELRALAEKFVEENGRKMTPNEYEAAAGEVRMSFPPSARPKPEFFREISQLSLDHTISDDGATTLGDTLVAGEPDTWDHQEDAAALALHGLENKLASKAEVRKDMWRIMSLRVVGAPQPAAGTLTRKTANSHRRLLEEAGGAHAVALAWLDGDATEEQEAALFAPFGELDQRQRMAVLDVMDATPGFADRIWSAGLVAATQ